MPVGLHPIEVIINVHWGGVGAVFVAAGDFEMILRAEIKKEDIKKRKGMTDEQKEAKPVFELIPIPSDFAGEGQYAGARGGSYRKTQTGTKAMFVLAGNDVNLAERHSWGTIMNSSDGGKTWTLAGKFDTPGPQGINDAGFQAMVWDGGFHAHSFSHEFYEAGAAVGTRQVDYYNVMFSGNEGTSFSESAREHIWNSEQIGGQQPPMPDPSIKPAAFDVHCANNPAKLPDGTFGYYEKRDSKDKVIESLLAVPESPSHYWLNYTNFQEGDQPSFDGQYASKTVKITIVKDGHKTEKSANTPIYVNGIAYVDEILVVGGRTDAYQAAIACSIDQGDTWEIVWQADKDYMQEIWVVMGAPLTDIKQTTA